MDFRPKAIYFLLIIILINLFGCGSSVSGTYVSTVRYSNGTESGILKPKLVIKPNGEYHYSLKSKKNFFSKPREEKITVDGVWTMERDTIKLNPALWGGSIFIFKRKISFSTSTLIGNKRPFLKKKRIRINRL